MSAVDVHFMPHGGHLGREWRILPLKSRIHAPKFIQAQPRQSGRLDRPGVRGKPHHHPVLAASPLRNFPRQKISSSSSSTVSAPTIRAARLRRRARPAQRAVDHVGISLDHRVGDHHLVHRPHAARARAHRLVHLLRRSRLRRFPFAIPQPCGNLPARKRFSPGVAFPAPRFRSIPCARSSSLRSRSSIPLQPAHCAGAERRAYETLESSSFRSNPPSNPARTKIHLRVLAPLRRDLSPAPASESSRPRNSSKSSTAPSAPDYPIIGTQSEIVATGRSRLHRRRPGRIARAARRACGDLRFPSAERARCLLLCAFPGAVLEQARQWLGDRADVRPEPRAAAEGWFGPARRIRASTSASATSRSSCVALQRSRTGRRESRGTCTSAPRRHSEDEMMIPLILEKT